MRSFRVGLAISAAALACGCTTVNNFVNSVVGVNPPQQVSPDQFQSPSVTHVAGPVQESGALNPDNPRLTPSFQPVASLPPEPAPRPPIDQEPGINSVVAQTTKTATLPQGPTTAPTAAGLATEPSVASGEYLSLGGVVAQVNGTPIYANKVLRLVEPGLRNDASQMGPDQFVESARNHIQDAIEVLTRDELQYAAAEQSLNTGDRKIVSELTTQYRQTLITQAGGSIEVARRKAAANGDDFDDLVRSQYRKYMIELFWQRNYYPQAETTAEEMREYYQQNSDKFSEPSTAVFDLLRIDPAQMHSDTPAQDRQMAFDRAKDARQRAAAGNDFATLFKEYNNDPRLDSMTNGTGNMGENQRGSFGIQQIEDAVWTLQPGQVSDVIDIDGVLYVAKLESRKIGAVHPFEDENVQQKIRTTIENGRLARLQTDKINEMRREASVTPDDQMIQTTVDIAMQNYHAWTGK